MPCLYFGCFGWNTFLGCEMTKAKYFRIYELVDKRTYNKYGQFAWQFIDPRLIKAIDTLRKTFGSATINSWKWGGQYKNSGLRTPQCKIGSAMSQHRFGRGADMKFKNVTPQEVRKAIRKDLDYWKKLINCIENKTPTWVHVDVRNCIPIKFVNP